MALPKSDYVRVFFGVRDLKNRPRIAYVDIDPARLGNVLALSPTPILEPGPWGHFDDNGVYPGNIIDLDGALYLYYMGRSNGEPPIYYMSIGLACSRNGGDSFERVSPAPILGRSANDPWMTTTPWVMCVGERDWRMWYTSGIGWESLTDKISRYHIKMARSCDGVEWEPEGKVAIPLRDDETNVSAPTVWLEANRYHMLYCRVTRSSGTYQLGQAISDDGMSWRRRDDDLVGLELSGHGWDDRCMAYPSVFWFRDRQYLLYSGNGLGREGFGLARREDARR